jgi:hypothetical protein
LDSRTECPYLDVAWRDGPPIDSGFPGGLVWHDDAFYSCLGELMRIEVDGTVGASGLPCDWVTAHGAALVVYDHASAGDFVREYATWADAVALGPATVHALSDMLASRFAVADGVIYGAWHSTDRVERRAFDSGDVQADIVLSGFDDRVDGIEVDAGEILITNDNVLLRFDAETGAAIDAIATGAASFGTPIDCR